MKSIQTLYDTAVTRRVSISSALAADQAQREPLSCRAKRDECTEAMRCMLASAETEGRAFTSQENADWADLEKRVDVFAKEISFENAKLDRDAQRHFGAGSGTLQAPPIQPTGWHDLDSGPVNVYAPHEAMAREPAQGSVGAMIRAMITGKGRADIQGLGEGSISTGGALVPEEYSRELIDLMRSKTRVIQAGARIVDMQAEKLNVAGILTDPTPAWRAENAAITQSDPTFSRLTFTARWLGVLVKTSRELAEDSPNFADAIQTSISGALAVEWDRVALFGSGTPPEPRGVVNTTGIQTAISMGANGGQLANYSQILQAVAALAGSNSELPTAIIMAPRTLYSGFSNLKDSTNQQLMAPDAIKKIPMLDTSSVPILDTQGTATNASRVVIGDFRQMWIGVRSQLRIEIMPEPYAANHQLAVICWIRGDVQIAQPKAFAQIIGIIP